MPTFEFDGEVDALVGALDEVSKRLKATKKDGDAAAKSADKHAKELDQLTKASAAAAGGLLAAGTAMVKLTQHVNEQRQAVANLSERTATSTQMVQTLALGARTLGEDVDFLEEVLEPISEQLGEVAAGSAEAEEKFNAVGVSVRDVNGNLVDMDTVLERTAEQMRKTSSDAERLQIAQGLVEDGGGKLKQVLGALNFELDASSKFVERFGISMEESAERSAKAQTSLAQLTTVTEGLRAKVSDTVGLNELLDEFTLGFVFFGTAATGALEKVIEKADIGIRVFESLLTLDAAEFVSEIGEGKDALFEIVDQAKSASAEFFILRERMADAADEADNVSQTLDEQTDLLVALGLAEEDRANKTRKSAEERKKAEDEAKKSAAEARRRAESRVAALDSLTEAARDAEIAQLDGIQRVVAERDREIEALAKVRDEAGNTVEAIEAFERAKVALVMGAQGEITALRSEASAAEREALEHNAELYAEIAERNLEGEKRQQERALERIGAVRNATELAAERDRALFAQREADSTLERELATERLDALEEREQELHDARRARAAEAAGFVAAYYSTINRLAEVFLRKEMARQQEEMDAQTATIRTLRKRRRRTIEVIETAEKEARKQRASARLKELDAELEAQRAEREGALKSLRQLDALTKSARVTDIATSTAAGIQAALASVGGIAPAASPQIGLLVAGAATQTAAVLAEPAPQFVGGGMVPSSAPFPRFGPQPDERLILARPNEGVVTEVGIDRLGGPEGLGRVNQDLPPFERLVVEPSFNGRSMDLMVEEVYRAGGRTRRALRGRRRTATGVRRVHRG